MPQEEGVRVRWHLLPISPTVLQPSMHGRREYASGMYPEPVLLLFPLQGLRHNYQYMEIMNMSKFQLEGCASSGGKTWRCDEDKFSLFIPRCILKANVETSFRTIWEELRPASRFYGPHFPGIVLADDVPAVHGLQAFGLDAMRERSSGDEGIQFSTGEPHNRQDHRHSWCSSAELVGIIALRRSQVWPLY
jgi:hypothetical protein